MATGTAIAMATTMPLTTPDMVATVAGTTMVIATTTTVDGTQAGGAAMAEATVNATATVIVATCTTDSQRKPFTQTVT